MKVIIRNIFISLTALYCISVYSQTIPVYNIVRGDTSVSSGYYFMHVFKVGSPSLGFRDMILDRKGELVYFKPFNFIENDFKLHPNGLMSYCFSPPNNPANLKFMIMDSTFFVKDSVVCRNGISTDAHDIQILPNGHYLLMGYETRVMNLSSYHWFSGNGSPGSSSANVKCGVIQELDENKNLVFSWKAADYYQFDDVEEEWLFSPVNVDWTHFNSVGMDTDGNILVSLRHFSEVTKINRQTGAIMWRLGGKENQFTFVNDAYNGFKGQHDARRIANGNVTLYDDGKISSPIHPARGVEYNLNTQTMTAALVWSHIYSANSTSQYLGNVQRLANNNTVIGWGGLTNSNVIFSCVKSNGGLVMEINFPDTLLSYRAFNYAQIPWRFNRPPVQCIDSATGSYLDAGAGFASYKWSTGETTRKIRINTTGTYYVFVPYGQGGYISSERIAINSLVNICQQITAINEEAGNMPYEFKLYQNYPNPFNPETRIKFEIPLSRVVSEGRGVLLKIYSSSGQEIEVLVNQMLSPGVYEVVWDASNYSSGIYFYTLESGSFKQSKKMLLIK